MLVLSRQVSQKIMIGENIVVTIVKIQKGQVRIGITAPKETLVIREELGITAPKETLVIREELAMKEVPYGK